MSTLPVYAPKDWKSTDTGYYSINVDNTLFAYEGASQSYSLSAPDSNTVRFELHAGDAAAWDVAAGHAADRDEIASRSTLAANNTAIEISYGFTLEPGAANTAGWMVLGQLHQNLEDTTATGGPVFGVYLTGENMSVIVRSTDANGKLTQTTLWTDPLPIVRGQEYNIDVKMIPDPTGQNGRLVVSRDGVTVADYSGAIGDPKMTGVYWAEGIYRDSNATESVAADYSNLQITTGSAVQFPAKSAFVAAPVLKVANVAGAAAAVAGAAHPASVAALAVGAAASINTYKVALSGTIVANGTVAIYENGQVVGKGTADGQGNVTVSVAAAGAGTHAYYSIATDATGHSSPTANPVDVVIGTAAAIGGSLDALNADPNLGAIYVTDSQVLNIGTTTDLNRILHDTATLSKIEGALYLRTTTAIAGKTYDTEVLTNTLTGTLVERQRYAKGALVLDQVIAADNSSVTKTLNTLGGFDAQSTAGDGFMTAYSRYDANGNPSYAQTFGRDGSSTTINYNLATGLETSYVHKAADKSSVSVTFGITGQAYAVQMLSTNAAGALIDQERFTATGLKTFAAVYNADGSHSITNYDPKTGRETSTVVSNADGTSVQEVFGITGKSYTAQTTFFDKANKVTSVTTSNAVGDVPPASTFILGLLNSSATIHTTINADGSKSVATYQVGSSTVLAGNKVYAASGVLVESDGYGASGTQVSSDVFTAGAGDLLTTFDANGVVSGTLQTNADGSRKATAYQPGSASVLASVANYSAAGVLSEAETYDATGRQVEVDGYDALGRKTSSIQRFSDGSRASVTLDGASGAVLQSSTVHADGSRTDVNNAITGKSYAEQSTSYSAAGKVVGLMRYYGDAAHTLALSQVTNADGSVAVHNYDAAGRETSRTLTAADGSAEVVNSSYTGSGTQPTTVQDYHYAPGNKLLWSDTTNANGSHNQVAAGAGVSLTSTGGVADSFTAASAGADTFVFQPAFGQDMVTNFHAGAGAAHDTLDLGALHLAQGPGQSSLDVLAQSIKQVGRDAVLTLTPTDTVTLKNTTVASLTKENFRV